MNYIGEYHNEVDEEGMSSHIAETLEEAKKSPGAMEKIKFIISEGDFLSIREVG